MFPERRNNQLSQILLRDEDEGKGRLTGFGNMRIGGDPHKGMVSRVLRKRTALECNDGCVSILPTSPPKPFNPLQSGFRLSH